MSEVLPPPPWRNKNLKNLNPNLNMNLNLNLNVENLNLNFGNLECLGKHKKVEENSSLKMQDKTFKLQKLPD